MEDRSPEKLVVRDGLQAGEARGGLAKVTPRFPRRSGFGSTGCGVMTPIPESDGLRCKRFPEINKAAPSGICESHSANTHNL